MKTSAISIAKVTPPVLPEIYPRSRLFQWIDRASSRPVLFVSGLAGAGKTTLVRSYVEQAGLPCLWYLVDEGDHDLGTVFHFLSQAAARANPKKRTPLPRFTPECLGGLSVFSRDFFQAFYDRLPPATILVFDNYQKLSPDSRVHEVLCAGIEALPEKSRIILIGRDPVPPLLVRLQANRVMAVLGWEELSMTREEAEGIGRLLSARKKIAPDLSRVYEEAQGWIAGLVLLLEGGGPGKEKKPGFEEGTAGDLFEYFKSEVFENLDEPLKNFLLQSSFLPRMTVRMVTQLTGIKQSARILPEFYRRNYFTERRPGLEAVYQYHPLFRDFLLSRARREFESERLKELQSRAAGILKAEGEVGESLELLRGIESWEEMIRIICEQAPVLFGQGRVFTLEEWLGWIPQEIEAQVPWLLYWRGICTLLRHPEISTRYFERAYEMFGRDQSGMGQYLSWSGSVDSYLTGWGDFRPLDRWIAELPRLMERYPEIGPVEIEANVVRGILCALTFRDLVNPEIKRWVERAETLLSQVSEPTQKLMIGNTLMGYYIWLGDHVNMVRVMKELHSVANQQEGSLVAKILWNAWKSAGLWLTLSFENCRLCIETGMSLLQHFGKPAYMEIAFLSQGVFCELTSGQPEAAREYLQKMSCHINDAPPVARSQYHYVASLEALYRKDYQEAFFHCRENLKWSTECGEKIFQILGRITLAQACFENGEREDAWRYLKESLQINQGMQSKDLEFQCLLSEAMFDFGEGKESAGVTVLREALALGKKQGYVNIAWWRPWVMIPLFKKALEHGIEVDYVRQLIRLRRLVPEEPPLHIESWPWPVKIFTLGRFEVQVDDVPIRFTGKLQHRPLDLLKVLVALGGQEVSEDRLTEILWPDADGENAQRSLDTTLHRLRKLLDNDDVLQHKARQLSLDPRHCWIDVWALESLLRETIDTLQLLPVSDEKIDRLMKKVLTAYPGPFLGEDLGEGWTLPLRNRLQNNMLAVLDRVGTYFENREEWNRAAEIYWKALEVDEIAEGFHRRLMICCRKLDRKAEIVLIRSRLEKAMKDQLGTQPSLETERLYRLLLEN